MTEPYFTTSDDGEGTAAHPVPGVPGATATSDYLSAWSTIGYTAQLGPNGTFDYTALIPSQSPYAVDYAQFPSELLPFATVTARYFSPDGDPLGGFLTFMPSSAITVTDTSGASYRIPRRLSGTETWPALDSGVSPWAFSMEGSGRIYVWLGLLTVKLLACNAPGIVTDDGEALTYHVTEHFVGGKQFDISIPQPTSFGQAVDLYSSVVPGTIRSAEFDPVNPLGSLFGNELEPAPASFPVQCQSVLSTEYVTATIGAITVGGQTISISGDTINFAFTHGLPNSATVWNPGSWLSGGPPYQAQALVGPSNGGVALAAGRYQIWVQVIDDPQVVVLRIGTLVIN
jgi:hypothetical protein